MFTDRICRLRQQSMIRDVLAIPAVYRAWQAPFVRQKLRPIVSRHDLSTVGRVIDIGCGPGTNVV